MSLLPEFWSRDWSRRGSLPRLLPKPHCTGPSWTFLRVVSLLEGGPTSPFRAEPGRVPWTKTRPPGARLRAPTPGQTRREETGGGGRRRRTRTGGGGGRGDKERGDKEETRQGRRRQGGDNRGGDKREETKREETKTAMTGLKHARLRMILGENNTEKLTLPNGIPDSIDELLSKVKDTFGLKYNIRLRYMDEDFGNGYFNLISTTELKDLGTIKWPEDFPVPRFSYDTELQLEKGNTEYQDNSAEDVQRDLEKLTTAVFVIRKEGEGLQEPPADIGIVIEGMEVLHDLTSVASACAHLLGLVYILNLAYPKPLCFTFEVFQKVFMQLDSHKMSYKVQSLYGRLHSLQ
ncbi:hypothetical protein L3Q82_003743 [Scortum barcoo]|uniref:Uncharacterized protein n=1 Tax=Scortum barcoo TaxID=214431 RepID=A0ACB8X7V0_9TELE|nr:hypothetical protein L3Q82_003743 [Scortum barcoo]